MRGEDDGLGPPGLGFVAQVGDLLVLADGLAVVVERMNFDALAEGIFAPDGLDFLFFGGEALNDLLRRHALGEGGVEFAFAAILCACERGPQQQA